MPFGSNQCQIVTDWVDQKMGALRRKTRHRVAVGFTLGKSEHSSVEATEDLINRIFAEFFFVAKFRSSCLEAEKDGWVPR